MPVVDHSPSVVDIHGESFDANTARRKHQDPHRHRVNGRRHAHEPERITTAQPWAQRPVSHAEFASDRLQPDALNSLPRHVSEGSPA